MTSGEHDLARVVEWLNQPHVREWWDPDGPEPTSEQVRRDYGSYPSATSHGVACIIEDRGNPVGFLQFYPWSEETEYAARVGIIVEPTAWAFDVFIGDPGAVGTGVATRALELVCRHLVDERGATSVVIVTETGNVRAHHVYEKLGFRKTQEILDDDTRGGERVRSYVMRREA
jgi:aminoglycoside 6'-N-acetyltransferase